MRKTQESAAPFSLAGQLGKFGESQFRWNKSQERIYAVYDGVLNTAYFKNDQLSLTAQISGTVRSGAPESESPQPRFVIFYAIDQVKNILYSLESDKHLRIFGIPSTFASNEFHHFIEQHRWPTQLAPSAMTWSASARCLYIANTNGQIWNFKESKWLRETINADESITLLEALVEEDGYFVGWGEGNLLCKLNNQVVSLPHHGSPIHTIVASGKRGVYISGDIVGQICVWNIGGFINIKGSCAAPTLLFQCSFEITSMVRLFNVSCDQLLVAAATGGWVTVDLDKRAIKAQNPGGLLTSIFLTDGGPNSVGVESGRAVLVDVSGLATAHRLETLEPVAHFVFFCQQALQAEPCGDAWVLLNGTADVWTAGEGALGVAGEGALGVAGEGALGVAGEGALGVTGEGALSVRGVIRIHEDVVTCCATHPATNLVATASKDGVIALWNIATHQLHSTVKAHNGCITALALQRDPELNKNAHYPRPQPRLDCIAAVSAGDDRRVALWLLPINKPHNPPIRADVAIDPPTAIYSKHKRTVNAVIFSHDDAFVVTACSDRTLAVLRTGKKTNQSTLNLKLVHQLYGHKKQVHSVTFSPSKTEFASAGTDGLICIWKLDHEEPIATLSNNSIAIPHLQYINRKQLLSAGTDGLVTLWNISTRTKIIAWRADPIKLWWLAITPKYMLTAGTNRNFAIWKSNKDELDIQKREKRAADQFGQQDIDLLLEQGNYFQALSIALKYSFLDTLHEILVRADLDFYRENLNYEKHSAQELIRWCVKEKSLEDIIKIILVWVADARRAHLSATFFEELIAVSGYVIDFG